MLYILLVVGTIKHTWGIMHEDMVRRKWGSDQVIASITWGAD